MSTREEVVTLLERAVMLLHEARGYEQPARINAKIQDLYRTLSAAEPELMRRVRSRVNTMLGASNPTYVVKVKASGLVVDEGVRPWDGHEDTARSITYRRSLTGIAGGEVTSRPCPRLAGPDDLFAERSDVTLPR